MTRRIILIEIGGSLEEMVTMNHRLRSLTVTLDGGGSVITTGVKADVRIPYTGVITGWEIVADVTGSIVIDVWKDTYGAFPPVVGDSIAGSEKPTLASQLTNSDDTLTTWGTAVTAGDWVRINVDSVSAVHRVTLAIQITASN